MLKNLLGKTDNILAGLLFGTSAALSLLLFYESAGGSLVYRVIFSVLAISFDSTKIILWLRGVRERNAVFILLALALVGRVSSPLREAPS